MKTVLKYFLAINLWVGAIVSLVLGAAGYPFMLVFVALWGWLAYLVQRTIPRFAPTPPEKQTYIEWVTKDGQYHVAATSSMADSMIRTLVEQHNAVIVER